MERNTKFAAWILALLALVLMAPSEAEETMAEVDDGVDVYFRDADLGAMSSQAPEEYGDADPGDAGTLKRSFEGAPPQILHTVEDMLRRSPPDRTTAWTATIPRTPLTKRTIPFPTPISRRPSWQRVSPETRWSGRCRGTGRVTTWRAPALLHHVPHTPGHEREDAAASLPR